MAVLKTSDYRNLTDHLKVIDEVFNDAMADALNRSMYEDIVGVEMNQFRNDTIQLNHGLGGVEFIPENTDYPEATGQEGDFISFKKQKYGANVIYTFENRIYDEYNAVVENVESIVDSGISKIDQSFADILNKGHSAAAYTDVYGQSITPVGPDGLALFTAAHTNGTTASTFSNLCTDGISNNPVLSRAAIVATRNLARNYKDPQGVSRAVYLNKLLVSPDLEDQAIRIVGSDYINGSANNDINPLKGRIEVMAWEKLTTAGDGADTADKWYFFEDEKVKRTLKGYFSVMPQLAAPQEFDPNKNWNYLFHFLYSRGFSRAPYIYGSDASGS